MFVKNDKELDVHVKNNSRFIYLKRGSRHGWKGTILHRKMYRDYEKIAVKFDNGTYQEYAIDAFTGNNFDNPYLMILEDESNNNISTVDLKICNYVIINNNGTLLEFTGTKQEAIRYAAEQVSDSKEFTKVHIFRKEHTIQPKPKELEIIDYCNVCLM